MADRITADPGRLAAYSATTRATIAPALDATADYSLALLAYSTAPNDLSTMCHVDHRGTVEATLSSLAQFDELPEAFARALQALDGRMGPGLALSAPDDAAFDAAVDAALLEPDARADDLRRAAAEGADGDTPVWRLVWNAYSKPKGLYGTAVNLVNVGRWGRATARLRAIEAATGMSHLDLRATGLNRARRRALARQIVRDARRRLRPARAAAASADDALRNRRGPLTGLRKLVPERVATFAGKAAKPLGVAGIGLGVWDTGAKVRDGEWMDAGFGAAGVVGGGILLIGGGPVTIAAGTGLVVVSLGYEYGPAVVDAGGWLLDRGGEAVGKVGDGLASLGGGVRDLASKAEDIPVIGGLFD